MALTERNRSALYQGLSDIIDEEAVGELLSNIPAHGTDEPATKDFVRAEIATVRSEIADLRAEISGIDSKFSAVDATFAGFDAKFAGVEQRLSALVHKEVRASMHWTIGVMVSLFAVLIAALGTFGA